MDYLEIKRKLYTGCNEFVGQRIERAKNAMEAAQAAANEESKSSAGDKYETGRAMAQIERDRHAVQLAEALKLQQELAHIDVEKPCSVVQPGALVVTSGGKYFISIGAGKLAIDQTDFFAVSSASPIGARLTGRKVGDEVVFNDRKLRIEAIY